MVGSEQAIESVKVFVWLLSNALEAIVVIELILLVRLFLPSKILIIILQCKQQVITWVTLSKRD